MASVDQPAASQGRHCGACTACCVHLPIAAGILGPEGKPAGVPCQHAGVLGCRHYDRRPQVCIDFRCAWLNDPAWQVAWRPDRSGLLCLRETIDGCTPAALVYELRPDALSSETGGAILDVLQRTTALLAVIGVNNQETRFSGYWAVDCPHGRLAGPHALPLEEFRGRRRLAS